MAKLGKLLRTTTTGIMFWCPGCRQAHGIRTCDPNGDNWSYNGDKESPTFSPSVRTFWPASPAFGDKPAREESTRCHSFVRNGEIQFLSDCVHALAGKTVPMEPIPDLYGGGLDDEAA